MPSPTNCGPPAVQQPGVVVATQQRHEIGSGGQQAGVDALLAGEIADPRRHQGHRRTQVTIELLAVGGR